MIDLNLVYQTLKPELNQLEKSLNRIFNKQDGLGRKLYFQQAHSRGKRLRPALLFLSAHAVGKIKSIHLKLALVIELIHNASLVHDDVLDEARLRRCIPTVNQEWGNETAILFGDLVFANAFRVCAIIKSNNAIRIISKTANQMCYGELSHMSKKYDLSLTEEEYLKIIENKTASLFSAACYLGALFATTNIKYHLVLKKYGLNLGLAYQIIDDYLDWMDTEESTGKTAGTDLLKGRITLPLIRLHQVLPNSKRKILREFISSAKEASSKNDSFVAQKREIKNLMTDYKIAENILKSADSYIRKAQSALGKLPHSNRHELLDEIAQSIGGNLPDQCLTSADLAVCDSNKLRKKCQVFWGKQKFAFRKRLSDNPIFRKVVVLEPA